MTPRMGLRTRLTVFVTLTFTVAISLIAIVVVNVVEDDLIEDTRTGAETVLTTYLESIYGGVATMGVVDYTASTQFFYLDASQNEMTEQQYFTTIAAGFDRVLSMPAGEGELMPGGLIGARLVAGPISAGVISDVRIHPDTGELLDPTGTIIEFVQGPQPIGEPHLVDLGDDVVGLAQTLAFTDGTSFQVGVSSPLQPATDSLDTLRRLLWISVPLLIVAIAGITWLAATRALAPVHAISSRARAITAVNIDQRLPVPPANDEIRELATTVNDMLSRLELSQQRQRQFVADASHELRSPVAASRTQLEVAGAQPDTTDWATTAATVLAEQEHLSHVIDDLLTLSHLDETGPPAVYEVDLEDLIAAEADRPHSTPIRISIPAPVRIHGDRSLLSRAVRNLTDNAARHAEGDVLITLSQHSGNAVIDVDDDGPGVPPEQRHRIFDRFARVDSARDRHRGGAGLGLAIAREVAQAHSGDLTVSDGPLGGARFTLTLPISPTAASPT
jgi:signal transduction histidine kinase